MKKQYDFSKGKRGRILPPQPEPQGKTRITIRLDEDLVDHFLKEADKSGGAMGYQTLINDALRQFIAHAKWLKRRPKVTPAMIDKAVALLDRPGQEPEESDRLPDGYVPVRRRSKHNPPHPGKVLREYLGDMTVSEAAGCLQISRVTLSRVLNGSAGISVDMSLRLSDALGTHKAFWSGLQMDYDLWQAAASKGGPR